MVAAVPATGGGTAPGEGGDTPLDRIECITSSLAKSVKYAGSSSLSSSLGSLARPSSAGPRHPVPGVAECGSAWALGSDL